MKLNEPNSSSLNIFKQIQIKMDELRNIFSVLPETYWSFEKTENEIDEEAYLKELFLIYTEI